MPASDKSTLVDKDMQTKINVSCHTEGMHGAAHVVVRLLTLAPHLHILVEECQRLEKRSHHAIKRPCIRPQTDVTLRYLDDE